MKKFILLLATGFGAGLSPICSGTTGAVVGIPLAVFLTILHGHLWLQITIAFALTLLAIPICDYAEKKFGKKDDGRIVADEYMLLPICFVAQEPVWADLFGQNPDFLRAVLFTGMAFVVSRIFDILKLFPAYRLQSVRGGFGIVLDDFFADIYAWFAIWACNQYFLIPVVLPFFKTMIAP